jgi:hypothetical protein
MKIGTALIAAMGALVMYVGGPVAAPHPSEPVPSAVAAPAAVDDLASDLVSNEVIDRYCVRCHSERRLQGNLSLESFDATAPATEAELAEKVIVKLRAGMMPPPGANRPAGDTLMALAMSLEDQIDEVAAEHPDPGARTFQRLNRAEYQRSVREFLDLEIDAGDFLPLDTKSANFDNIADVQMLSPTLLSSYMNAAAEISRLAMGNPDATPLSATYTNSGYTSQWERVPGAPYGTRGGISVVHNFPADAEYTIRMTFEHTTTGGVYGGTYKDEDIEVSVDGERRQLIHFDRWMSVADPNGVMLELPEPLFVTAGPHRITAAFIKKNEGPMEDVLSPHDWSIADRQIGASGGYGVTTPAHMKDLVIGGPYDIQGVSETPSRERILSCRPADGSEERPCASEIIERLGPDAFRRPLTDEDREALLSFYDLGYAEGGFEVGIRTVVEALLASPDFIFRFEEAPEGVQVGDVYQISDLDLASRLSYFLWGLPPDDELLDLAAQGRLSNPEVLDGQVDRMLEDPRSEALATRFAAQWLRLDDLDKVHPDRLMFPDFHEQLKDAMRRETELLFDYLVREDKSFFELYTADYTFANERLARHYGIQGVTGDQFRRVSYADDTRRGLLGHGSVLTLTSHAGRTSPVLRGKWIMEVVMGTPPPPPPPGVPPLEETTEASVEGRVLTTKERMEQHRENPTCNACHRFIDPIGLALDSYDVVGQWRIKEDGVPLDTNGELYDGTPVTSPLSLQQALLDRDVLLVRSFTSNLMAYALGRRTEYFDQPTIRSIVAQAEEQDHRMSAYIKGVVESDAFQMQRAGSVADVATSQNHQ